MTFLDQVLNIAVSVLGGGEEARGEKRAAINALVKDKFLTSNPVANQNITHITKNSAHSLWWIN
jgi:hypothetical protein